jgi:hypothetical protein
MNGTVRSYRKKPERSKAVAKRKVEDRLDPERMTDEQLLSEYSRLTYGLTKISLRSR